MLTLARAESQTLGTLREVSAGVVIDATFALIATHAVSAVGADAVGILIAQRTVRQVGLTDSIAVT